MTLAPFLLSLGLVIQYPSIHEFSTYYPVSTFYTVGQTIRKGKALTHKEMSQ